MARTSTRKSGRASSSLSPIQLWKQITVIGNRVSQDYSQLVTMLGQYHQAVANAGEIAAKTGGGQRRGNRNNATAQTRTRTATATKRRGRPRKQETPMAMTAGQLPNLS
jgi:hypothetical protein